MCRVNNHHHALFLHHPAHQGEDSCPRRPKYQGCWYLLPCLCLRLETAFQSDVLKHFGRGRLAMGMSERTWSPTLGSWSVNKVNTVPWLHLWGWIQRELEAVGALLLASKSPGWGCCSTASHPSTPSTLKYSPQGGGEGKKERTKGVGERRVFVCAFQMFKEGKVSAYLTVALLLIDIVSVSSDEKSPANEMQSSSRVRSNWWGDRSS